jgi:hypothetical protein
MDTGKKTWVRVLGALGVGLLLLALAIQGLSVWTASQGVDTANGVRVRFVPDDDYGFPTMVLSDVPSERLRAVVEQRRYDGNSREYAQFELGNVQRGDTVRVEWEPDPEATDPRRPFRLILTHDGRASERAIPFPWPGQDHLVLPTDDHPIDADGAVVMAYTLSWSTPDPELGFKEISPLYRGHWLVIWFEELE